MSTTDILSELLQPGGVTIEFQPIIRFTPQSETLLALEALARGPRGTNMENADLMFAYARRKNAEAAIDQCCITSALQHASVLPGNPTVALNVHAVTLTTIPGFADWLESGASGVGIHPSRLIIDIVEQAGAFVRTELRASLSRLRALGVRIAVHDIGCGANYGMLIDCHPEYLKVDRYVVHDCTSDPYRQAILCASAAVAQSSNSTVIAEGVELEEDMATLLELGIDVMQGFLISKPMTIEELLKSRLLSSSMVNRTSDCIAVVEG